MNAEYTLYCPDCDAQRRRGGHPRCPDCADTYRRLEAVLKSREGRLAVHAMLMQAEEAAGCEQSRLMMELLQRPGVSCTLGPRPPGPGHVPLGMSQWAQPQSLDQADRFQA